MSEPENINHTAADLRRGTETLAEMNLRLRRQLEVAEMLIPRLNEMLDQLHAIRLADSTVLAGRVIHQQPYLMSLGPQDSGQILQAALMLPGGFGVVVLDSEEYLDHQNAPIRTGNDLHSRFVRFDECQSAVKALLLPEAHKLLGRLFTNLAINGS